MKVGIFYNSIGNPTKFPNKIMLMDNFKQGVQLLGDETIDFRDQTMPDQKLDLGFVLGYTLEENFRQKIIRYHQKRNIPTVFVDSNILHYGRQEHEWHRYSLNSVYPDTGTYFFKELDTEKWETFSKWHNVSMKPWRDSGDHILILAQRPKGFNMFTNQEEWLIITINQIRKFSNKHIMIRMHPGDGTKFKQIERLKKVFKDSISFSEHQNIVDALKNCWCCVGYASTPNVVSAIEGIPVYVEEPEKSWAKDIAFTDLSLIKNPPLPDRSDWIHKIANIHWSNDEVRSGKLWLAIKTYISSAR
jgi:hypothetical protein